MVVHAARRPSHDGDVVPPKCHFGRLRWNDAVQFRLGSDKGFPACTRQRKVGHQPDFSAQGVVEVGGFHWFRLVGGRHQLAVGGAPSQVITHRGEAIAVVRARYEGRHGDGKRSSDQKCAVGVHG